MGCGGGDGGDGTKNTKNLAGREEEKVGGREEGKGREGERGRGDGWVAASLSTAVSAEPGGSGGSRPYVVGGTSLHDSVRADLSGPRSLSPTHTRTSAGASPFVVFWGARSELPSLVR